MLNDFEHKYCTELIKCISNFQKIQRQEFGQIQAEDLFGIFNNTYD